MGLRLILPTALMALMALPGTVQALELALPGNPSLSGEVVRDPDSYMLPTGPFADGALPTLEVEGRVVQQAWRIDAQGMTTLQMTRLIHNQLKDAGFELMFQCAGQACGGFDFRFNTRVMAAPDMYVDLFDYRYLAAMKSGPEYVSVLVSRSGVAGYVQIIHVTPEGTGAAGVQALQPVVQPVADSDQPLAQALMTRGHVILADLDFETGSAALGEGPFATLKALAGFLRADDTRRVALVGHTDAVGKLDSNIALSKRRAASVLERLVAEFAIPRAQLEAEGMGYLSPIAPNLTKEGREANRRVEAVLLNVE